MLTSTSKCSGRPRSNTRHPPPRVVGKPGASLYDRPDTPYETLTESPRSGTPGLAGLVQTLYAWAAWMDSRTVYSSAFLLSGGCFQAGRPSHMSLSCIDLSVCETSTEILVLGGRLALPCLAHRYSKGLSLVD